MNITTIHKILFFISVNLICVSAAAQKLHQSSQKSHQTYIYKLKQEEAKRIYKQNLWVVDSSFFHTLIDSFPQNKNYTKQLEKGYYLKTYFEKNKQEFYITSVQDFDVQILNNSTDLSIQIYDLEGQIISNAKVKVRHKKLRFDKKTQSYVDKKSNQKGLLSVTHEGFTAYYELSRRSNNPRAKRISKKILYGTPLKHAWRPIRFVALLPSDAIKSIRNYESYGGIDRVKGFFINSYYKVACLFDDYYCDEYYGWRYHRPSFEDKHTGYLVFNKDKYRQGDTVKFKAFISTQKGKPVNKTVEVRLWARNTKEKVLTKLKPYRKGAYEYEFALHDSLDLKLDTDYQISLSLNEDKTYISEMFHYEDYELSETKLSIWTSNENQFRNEPFKLYVKGTDENDLNLLDTRLEITLKSKRSNAYFAEHLFVPDTLLFLEQKLDASDETEILIPDSTFAKANFDYEITVRMLTSDNQSIYKNKNIHFFHLKKELDIQLQADSLAFTFKENGKEKSKSVKVFTADKFGNRNKIYEGNTPYKTQISPHFSEYIIESDSLSKTIDLGAENSLLQCFSSRTHNAIKVTVDNPRKIPFTYYIYKKNNQKSRGYTKSLTFERKTKSNENYLVYLRYLWGGQIKEENYPIQYLDRLLNVSVSQAKRVYPSQKTKIEVLVTDAKGKPVSDVDLTAYSMTKKFKYTPPSLPYFPKRRKKKDFINSFKTDNIRLDKTSSIDLDYSKWKKTARLDSIEYYKFIYPQDSMYRFAYPASDSITQFAPFVLKDGEFQAIHVIYVDYKPVYFSWSTNYQPYSFKIDSGFHQIKLRTAHREITLDSLHFEEGKKLVFSLNQDVNQPKIRVQKLPDSLIWQEQDLLYKYIFPYRDNFHTNYTYLENNGDIEVLGMTTRNYNQHLAGPVSGSLSFHILDSSSVDFVHEPFFQYDISFAEYPSISTIFKLKDVKRSNYPKYLSSQQSPKNLTDLVVTKEVLQKRWKELIKKERYTTPKYDYPTTSEAGTGRLRINFIPNKESPHTHHLNILIFQYDKPDFLRIYPSNISEFYQLQEGLYQFVYFYPDGHYFIADSVDIQINGFNFHEIKEPKTLKKDNFSTEVHEIIEKNAFKSYSYEQSELEKIKLRYLSYKYREAFENYTGEFKLIQGRVLDISGEGLPGVVVQIKGTTQGVVTDLDGYYSIKVPLNRYELTFSFVGMNEEERTIENNGVLNVDMTENEQQLSEVVVTALGITRMNRSYGYAQSSTVSAMAGKAAGVQVIKDFDNLDTSSTIKIRGMSSISSDNSALYVVDGVPYNGSDIDITQEMIASISVLKGTEATALYGSRGANGVVLISTKKGAKLPKELTLQAKNKDNQFLEAVSKASSIRNNFSDYAFWQPKLRTNKEGKASFEVTFPDDITSWDTFYLAMNGHKQSGQTKSNIKSYKPLMARLALPRFLVDSDTAFAIGKVLNYSSDSLEVTRKLEVDKEQIFAKKGYCSTSIIDTLAIHTKGNSDSLSVKYFLEKEDGYFDGELRKIPVFPIGIEQTKGEFYSLEGDTTFQLPIDSTFKKVKLYARASMLEVLEDEIQHLSDYKYLCNEQAASKLKAILSKKSIAKYKGKAFKLDKDVEKLILLLEKRQNKHKLWAWWGNATEVHWISLHVLEALTLAQNLGYQIHLDKDIIIAQLVWQLQQKKDFATNIKIVKMLTLLKAQVDYKPLVTELENTKHHSFTDFLQILELKKAHDIECDLDTLQTFQQETLFGNVFYTNDKVVKSMNWFDRNVLSNDIQNTILAYKILKYDSLENGRKLQKMRNYFLEERKAGYWTNTYESAQIIETILPDLLGNKSKLSPPTLKFTGDLAKTVTKFPFEMKLDSKAQIQVTKSGDFPIYLSTYQKYWDKKPLEKKNDFEVKTYFENNSTGFLKAGEVTKLIVKVEVKKDAEYVMINVPIPAACSYASKKNYFSNEVHREYFRNETSIFCQSLKRGNYTFEVELLPKYTGTYTLNPTKIELMYFPTFNANNRLKKVLVK